MASMLESLSYRSITTSNGTAALQFNQSCRTALILLDICMPEMDGCEVVGYLKRNRKTAAIPVIAVTAMGVTAHEQFLAAGFDDYLMKPLTVAEGRANPLQPWQNDDPRSQRAGRGCL